MDFVENWFTFSAPHMRRGSYNGECNYKYDMFLLQHDVLAWKSRAYCQNCGAVYGILALHEPCLECTKKKWRTLVCRSFYREEITEIKRIWWKPSTWEGYKIKEILTWEYRIREDETKLDLPNL